MAILQNDTLNRIPRELAPQYLDRTARTSRIVHVGVGAFHRSHQAWVWHQLRQAYPDRYGDWSIIGVCLMPSDKPFVDKLRAQDHLYALREHPPRGAGQTRVVNSIAAIRYGDADREDILAHLCDADTRVVSLTITEGGYDTGSALAELAAGIPPTTVFGYLVHGLARRRAAGHGGVILLSCDNIQENGHVLRTALGKCLERFDPVLKAWVDEHVRFPNSMVDRITPATSPADIDAFEGAYGVRDEVLVVCEDYFQWVLEDSVKAHLPPLDAFGVEFVADVRPYELMKLSILNAGHSLVGLLGDALGYRTIHEAVADPFIATALDRYAISEAIPVLAPLEGVDYRAYYQKVKARFSNAMMNDSTARIIGGSSDKIPKFLLPIVRAQRSGSGPQVDMAVLVIAAWWLYLRNVHRQDAWASVVDTRRDELKELFAQDGQSASRFLAYDPIFGDLAAEKDVAARYAQCIRALEQDAPQEVLKRLIEKKHD